MCSHGGRHIVMTFPTFIELSYYSRQAHLFFLETSVSHSFSLATSVNVECVFSKGHLVLSHIRNHLSAQSTQRLMCLGLGVRWDIHIKGQDIKAVTFSKPELKATGHIEW